MPSELDSSPRVERIRELYEHVRTAWQRQRQLDTWLLEHYFGEQRIFLEDTADEKRNRQIEPERLSVAEAARIVDLIQSFYPEPPRMGVHHVGVKAKEPEAGENVAIALNEAINQLNKPADSPWRISTFNKILLGRSADLICKGRDYWYDFPYKEDTETEEDWKRREAAWRRKAPIPVAWIPLPPETTFPASLSSINDEVISWKSVSWSDITDMFDDDEIGKSGVDIPSPNSKEWFQPVTLFIYSNRTHLAYGVLADKKEGATRISGKGFGGEYPDKVIRTIEHGLGRCAIRILPGITSGRKEPPYYWRSVLYPIISLLEAIDTLASRTATSAKFNAYPWMKMHLDMNAIDPDDDGVRAVLDSHSEGDVTFLNAGGSGGEGREDINPVFQPQHGEQARELYIHLLDRAGQITGANAVLEGQLSANQAAWSYNWSSEQAKRKLSPLTANIIGGAIDITESIALAVQAFDEEVVLANPDKKGSISLKPKALRDWQPVIHGSYDAQTPINYRADWETGMSLMAQTKELGYGPSPIAVMQRFMGIHEPWKHVMENMEFQIVLSEQMRRSQDRLFVERFEAQIAEDEGMTEEELLASGLPPDIIAAIQRGANGAGPQPTRVSPETAGAIRAGSPFSTGPTGPQPQEGILPE